MVDLSIVIPAYKVADKLERCVDSILSQSWKSYEIIVVNDASPDNVLEICKRYEAKYRNFKVISHQNNKGLPAARNTGVRAAVGEFIWHVDGDDYICDQQAIEKIIVKLKHDKTAVIKFGLIRRQNSGDTSYSLFDDEILNGNDVLVKAGANAICTYVYSREFAEKLDLFSLEGVNLGEDQILVLKLIRCSAAISTLKDCFYVYDMTDGSMMRKKWTFWQFMQDRLYLHVAKKLYIDRPYVLKALYNARFNYIKNKLINRAKLELNEIEFDLCYFAYNVDLNGVDVFSKTVNNYSPSLTDKYFSHLFESVEFVLHVGSHKTATTTTQEILELSKEDLALDGVIYISLQDFRNKITVRIHELSESEIRVELMKLIIPCLFGKVRKVIISEENLIGSRNRVLAGCVAGYFNTGPLDKFLSALKGRSVKTILCIRDFSPYLISMQSEMNRHREYTSFEKYFDFNVNKVSWSYLIDRVTKMGRNLEVFRFEDYRENINDFASYLSGYDLTGYNIIQNYDNRRSVASSYTHNIMMKYNIKEPKLYRKLDCFYAGKGKFSPINKGNKEILSNNYQKEWEGFCKQSNERLVFNEKITGISKMSNIDSDKKFSRMASVGDIPIKKPSEVGFKMAFYCNEIWRTKLLKNVEEIEDYYYYRKPVSNKGISAMIRVKNESENIVAVLESIKHLFDEICLIDNNSEDSTVELAKKSMDNCNTLKNKLKIYSYPFTVARCGDENFNTTNDSVHSLAYFYNWALSKCTYSYVWKWDGDMILDICQYPLAVEFKDKIVESKSDVGVSKGISVYKGLDGCFYFRPGNYESEPRLFPNTPLVNFEKDILWEKIVFNYEYKVHSSESPVFIELKDTNVDEFNHWSKRSLAWGLRKIKEYEDFNLIKKATGEHKFRYLLEEAGFERFYFK